MFVALRKDCFFRKYGEIGILIRPASSCEKVVNGSGSIFCEQLLHEPKSLDCIASEVHERNYPSVSISELKNDVLSFFKELADDGFLDMSDKKDDVVFSQGFQYSTLLGKTAYMRETGRLEESSSFFLRKFFQQNPCLETFHVEITSKCNERCVHCYIPHPNKTTNIESSLMKDVLRQCHDMNVLTVIFSGGEPLMHPDFIEFLRLAKDYDFNVTVLTNLTLLTDDVISALKYKTDSIVNVSLYSMDADVHDSITCVKGSFAKTRDNILRLVDNNVPVQINCPVMKQNRDSFHKVIEWGENLKCFVNVDMQLMARYDHTDDNLDNALDEKDFEIAIRNYLGSSTVYKSSALKNLSKSELDKIALGLDDNVCGVGFSTLCMTASGDVYPCAGWQGYKCGNLKKDTLQDIWNNSEQINKLRVIRNKDFVSCLDCEDKDFCRMCMSCNYNNSKNGDIFEIPKSTCISARVGRKIIEEFRKEHLH